MKTIPFVFIVVLFFGTKSLPAQETTEALYRKAIQTAIYPPGNTPNSHLIALVPGNKNLSWKSINDTPYVLVVTWAKKNWWNKPKDNTTGSYQLWVTAAPELRQRMKQESYTDARLRLTQLLGLPPGTTNDTMVELWVKPQDLFRPCPDKEINDCTCSLYSCTPKNAADSAYVNWITSTYIDRYYKPELYKQYPWTQLGYTYDWNPENKSHIGLCEFVIDAGKTVYVNRVCTTGEYLR